MKFSIASPAVVFALYLSPGHTGPVPAQAAERQTSMPGPAAATAPLRTPSPQPDPAAPLSEKLRNGMSYDEFRKTVLDLGWQPKSDAQCMANVVGGNFEKLCSSHPGLASCRACKEVPELSACSGDGHCQVHFAQEGSGAVLEANTYGPISDWNAPGDRSRMTVTEWQVEAESAH